MAMLMRFAKRDPELIILMGAFTVAAAMVGYQASHKILNYDAENSVYIPESKAMPWDSEGARDLTFKYKYYPRGDASQEPKDAPMALNFTFESTDVKTDIPQRLDQTVLLKLFERAREDPSQAYLTASDRIALGLDQPEEEDEVEEVPEAESGVEAAVDEE